MNIKTTAAIAILLFSNCVNALTISSGDVFTINWFVDLDDGVTTSDLTATSEWTVSSFSTTSIVIDITIENTTVLDPGILDEAAITSFGFGIEPDATAALTTSGGTFDMINDTNNQNFPGGFKGIDICLFADGCSGGAVFNGLQAGASDSLQVTLFGTFADTAELLFFPAKFQTTVGSFEPGGNIPEPGILALLGIGLIGFSLRNLKKTN